MTVARVLLAGLVLSTGAAGPVLAQTPAPRPPVELTGYVQPQFEIRSGDGPTRDLVLLRRAVLTLDITLTTSWQAEVQADLGPLTDDDHVTLKNVLLRYAGWEEAHGIVVSIGNQKIPFSRSVFMSSSRRSPIERPFTGDRAYGSPGRAISIRADGWHRDKTIFWSAAVADTRHGGDPHELRVDGVMELGDEGNEGHLLGGRLELHPFGEVPREHGDFTRGPLRVTVGAGAYAWRSHADLPVDPATRADVRRVSGLEFSGALRLSGLSVDAEFEHVSADARRPFPGDGLYRLGHASVRKGSIEAGYMLVPARFELLGAVDALDALTFDRAWRRLSAGANWYVRRHDLKFSFMHRESFHDEGLGDTRSRAAYVQAQFVF